MFLPKFSPSPPFSAYSQGKDFLLVLQGRSIALLAMSGSFQPPGPAIFTMLSW